VHDHYYGKWPSAQDGDISHNKDAQMDFDWKPILGFCGFEYKIFLTIEGWFLRRTFATLDRILFTETRNKDMRSHSSGVGKNIDLKSHKSPLCMLSSPLVPSNHDLTGLSFRGSLGQLPFPRFLLQIFTQRCDAFHESRILQNGEDCWSRGW
jgi:hypothetical protein